MATRLFKTSGRVSKIGVVTRTTQWEADTELEALEFLRSVPEFEGLWITDDCGYVQAEDNKYEITAVYAGALHELSPDDDQGSTGDRREEEDGGGGFTYDPKFVNVSFSGSMEKVSATLHPNFQALRAKYGWDAENQQFPEYLPQDFGGTPGRAFGGKGIPFRPERSSLAGADSYLEVGGEYSVSYVKSSVSPSVLLGVGVVAEPPRVDAVPLPPDRNFLKLMPEISIRGSVFAITEKFLMSGPSGWNTDVYDKAQLDPAAE